MFLWPDWTPRDLIVLQNIPFPPDELENNFDILIQISTPI